MGVKHWRAKNWILGFVFIMIAIAGVLIFVLPKENKFDAPMGEQLSFWQTAAAEQGRYDAQRLIINDAQEDALRTAAEAIGGSYRMAEVGDMGVLYLPDGMTLDDLSNMEPVMRLIPNAHLDYYAELASGVRAVDVSGTVESLNCRRTMSTETGSGVTIAVIDTGIDVNGTAFSGRISEKSYNVTQDKMVSTAGKAVIQDKDGHGTYVSGILAASADSDAPGIAPEAKLLVIRCEMNDQGEMNTSDLVLGLAHAIACDADIVNMSFSVVAAENPFEKYTKLAVDSDIICVAAAGNMRTSVKYWPAADENVIGVGYTAPSSADGEDEKLGSSSNYGDNCDLVAPGSYSLLPLSWKITAGFGDDADVNGGSSYSCAATSAALALYLSSDRALGHEYASVKEVLLASCRDLGEPGADWYYGYGALDIDALVMEDKGTITFDALTDEVETETHIFVRNHTLQYTPEPERTYAVLDGWYFEPDCVNEYDNTTAVLTDDITVYALWVNEDDTLPYTYVIQDDGTAKITGYTGKRRHLTIPSRIDGYSVTAIGESAFSSQSKLRTVVLPDTLKVLCSEAFRDCTMLTSVQIPENVERIEERAFYNCAKLRTVGIPASGALVSVGDYAFAYCGCLSRFDIPTKLTSINATAFYSDMSMVLVTVSAENARFSIQNDALVASGHLVYYPTGRGGEYTVAPSVTAIDAYAFAYSQIRLAVLPEELTTIGESAFLYSCLERLDLPEMLTMLGEGCFECNYYLKSVRLNSQLKIIPEKAFSSCTGLTELIVPENVQLYEVGNDAFSCCSLSDITSFSQNLTVIGKRAFQYNNFSEIKLGKNVQLWDEAFYGCMELSDVQFAEDTSYTVLPNNLFGYCKSLKAVSIPDSITELGDGLFSESGLETLTLGKSITKIDSGAFSACEKLEAILVNDENPVYFSVDGVLFEKNDSAENAWILHTYPAGKQQTEYTFPETVQEVSSYAFSVVRKLEAVTFNNGLQKIGECAFEYCTSVQTITCPASLNEIGGRAFEGCSTLTQVVLNEGLRTIGTSAFENCLKLERMTIPSTVVSLGRFVFSYDYALTSVLFADGAQIQNLGQGTFSECGITQITIPASVEFLSPEVFTGCQSLASVTFAANSRLKAIPAWTFRGAQQLKEIVFEEGSALESIQARAFEYLPNLTYVQLATCGELTNIDNYAFQFCSELGQLVLPEKLDNIGRYAFYGCKQMKELQLPASVSRIGQYAFAYCNPVSIYFTSSALPQDLEENWDYGIKGYNCGSAGIQTSADGVWKYMLSSDGTVSIVSYNGTDTSLTLSEIDGKAITSIGGGAFQNRSMLECVILPATLKAICNSAFEGTVGLTKIDIPASVSHIGSRAFYGSGLEQLTFAQGSSLQSIASSAFENTLSLQSVALPAGVKDIQRFAFYKSGLREVVFAKDSVLTAVGDYAFSGTNLAEVSIPDSVLKIGYHCFENDVQLEKVDFPENGSIMLCGYAFYRTGLKDITLPKSVTYVGEFCFSDCEQLTAITAVEENGSYTSADGVLFNKSQTKLVTFPAGKTGSYTVPGQTQHLAFGAFEGAKLQNVAFPSDSELMTIGYRAFYNAAGLERVRLPACVQSVDFYAFANCTNLSEVVVPNDSCMSGIYQGAFYHCAGLREISIPDTVREIGDNAFDGCESLSVVKIAETSGLIAIGDQAFAHTNISAFAFPAGLLDVGQEAFSYTALDTFALPASVEYVGPGVLKGTTPTKLTLSFLGYAPGDYETATLVYTFDRPGADPSVLPDTLKSVHVLNCPILYASAFEGADTLECVTLETPTVIAGRAFSHCKALREVHTGGKVTYVGIYAFYGCENLTTVDFLDSMQTADNFAFYECKSLRIAAMPSLTTVGGETFFYCSFSGDLDLSSVRKLGGEGFRYASGLGKVRLSDNLECIGDSVFSDTDITSINIPGTVSAVPENAFHNCHRLTDVDLAEGIVEIGESAFVCCESLREVRFPSTLERIGDSAFDAAGLHGVQFNKGLKHIGSEAFTMMGYGYAGKGFYAYIPDTVETIGAKAFPNTVNVYFEADTLPAGADADWDGGVSQHENTWYTPTTSYFHCSALTDGDSSIYFCTPDGLHLVRAAEGLTTWSGTSLNGEVVAVAAGAFYKHAAIREIVLPDSVREVQIEAARECPALQTLTLGSGTETLGSGAFILCEKLSQVVIPQDNSLISIGPECFSCTALKSFDFTVLTKLRSFSRWAFDETRLQKADLRNCTKLEKLGDFVRCHQLKEVYLNENYAGEIPEQFLENTSVESFVIPKGVTSIGVFAFERSKLESITIPENVTEIARQAFYECTALCSVTIQGDLQIIGEEAFYHIPVEEMHLPKSLTTIGDRAFERCDLTLYFEATKLPENLGVDWDSGVSKYYLGIPMQMLEDPQTHLQYALLDDGTAAVGGYLGSDPSLVIDQVAGAPVSKILPNAFAGNTVLETVTFGSNVKTVMMGAFENCDHLKTVDLAQAAALQTIGDAAFAGCAQLQEFTLPAQVQTLGADIFRGCTALQTADLSAAADLAEIPDSAFSDCVQLSSVPLGNGVQSIGSRAFYRCAGLHQLPFPANLRSVGEDAFYGTGLLESEDGCTFWETCLCSMDAQDSAVIPEGYTILASNAVRAKEVVLPSSMRHLSADCFAVNGNPLQTIVLNDGLQTIGARAFASTQIEEITIPDSVTFIGKDALSGDQLACATIPFLGCTPQSSGTLDETFGSGLMALKDLTITCEMESIPRLLPLGVNSSIQSITFSGDHCSRIEDYAFYQMYHLEEVQIPEGCTSIGDYAFFETALEEFPCFEQLETIGAHAFENSRLKRLRILDGVRSIGEQAFIGCHLLQTISLPATVETIGSKAFYSMSTELEDVVFPFPGTAIQADGTVAGTLSDILDIYGGYTDNDGACLNLTITGPVSAIPDEAFQKRWYLKTVTVASDTVREIGRGAFGGNPQLEEVILPDSVTSIGASAFCECSSLQHFSYSKSLKSLGESAFYKSGLIDALLPEGLETIGGSAFGQCYALKTVILPKSLKTIGDFAFFGSGVEYIELPENIQQQGLLCLDSVNLKGVWIHGNAAAAMMQVGVPSEVLILDNVEGAHLKDIIGERSDGKEMNVVLTDSVSGVPADFMDGVSDVQVYCCRDTASGWPEGWNAGNQVHYRGTWTLSVFRANGVIVSTCLLEKGGVLQSPLDSVAQLEDDQTGSYTFLGWDTNGDKKLDNPLSVSTSNGIVEVQAVYATTASEKVDAHTVQALASGEENLLEARSNSCKVRVQLTGSPDISDETSLLIRSEFANVTLDAAALRAVRTNAVLTMEEADASVLQGAGTKDKLFVLKFDENGEDVPISGNCGKIRICLPLSETLQETESVNVYSVAADGTRTRLPIKIDLEHQTVSCDTDHLGMFQIAVETGCEAHVVSMKAGECAVKVCVAAGNVLQLPSASNDEKEFRCWSDGQTTYSAGSEIKPLDDVFLTALWWENTDLRSVVIQQAPSKLVTSEGVLPDLSEVELLLTYTYGARTVKADSSMLTQLDVTRGGCYDVRVVFARLP